MSSSPSSSSKVNQENHPNRILFGSCSNNQHYSQKQWTDAVLLRNATAFIWGGDAIYADRNVGLDYHTWPPKPKIEFATPKRIKELYRKMRLNPHYKRLLDTNISIFGTIDDHDLGMDNADNTYPYKRESAMIFVKTFLHGISNDDEEEDSSIFYQRAKDGKGVYGVQLYDFSRSKGQELLTDEEAMIDPDVKVVVGDESSSPSYSKEQSVAIFVLDSRSHKTPWIRSFPEKLYKNYNGDFLGEHQWTWFQKALQNSQATVNIIVNGMQVGAERYMDANVAESWSHFPTAQSRLYNTILESNVRSPILVSGDVHHSQIMRKDCMKMTKTSSKNKGYSFTRSIMEVTTSGLTHSWGTRFCSRPDTNWVCKSFHTTWATNLALHIGHYMNPWTDVVVVVDENDDDESTSSNKKENTAIYQKGMQYALEANFGEMEFDWINRQVILRIHGIDATDKKGLKHQQYQEQPLLIQHWTFDELNGNAPMMKGSSSSSRLSMHDFETSFQKNTNNGMPWTCLNYRGIVNPYMLALTNAMSLCLLTTLIFLPAILMGTFGCYLVLRTRRGSNVRISHRHNVEEEEESTTRRREQDVNNDDCVSSSVHTASSTTTTAS